MSNSYTALGFSARHIVLIVLDVIITKQRYQIGIVGLVYGKIKLTATLTAFLHTAIDKVFKERLLIVVEYSSQIRVILHIVLIVIDRGILVNNIDERLVL